MSAVFLNCAQYNLETTVLFQKYLGRFGNKSSNSSIFYILSFYMYSLPIVDVVS